MDTKKKTYSDRTRAVKPEIMSASAPGTECYVVAFLWGERITLRKGKKEKVSRLLLRVPLKEENGVKYYLTVQEDDVEAFNAYGITRFSTVKVEGVVTRVTECFEEVEGEEPKLRFVNYRTKDCEVTVTPPDPAIGKFDRPLVEVEQAPSESDDDDDDDEE